MYYQIYIISLLGFDFEAKIYNLELINFLEYDSGGTQKCNLLHKVGWCILGININKKLKKKFSYFNEKLKGVVKKYKKI